VSVDPRAKSAMWRVRRALRLFQAASWSAATATGALMAEGLTQNVIAQELERRSVARLRAKTLAKWARQRRRQARRDRAT
jgi:hypothetical protein